MVSIEFDIAGPGDSVSRCLDRLMFVIKRELNDALSEDPELSIDMDSLEFEP